MKAQSTFYNKSNAPRMNVLPNVHDCAIWILFVCFTPPDHSMLFERGFELSLGFAT